MAFGASGGRARARWLAACALLLGLFLMHGAPASAGTGCHATASGPAQTALGHEAGAASGPAQTPSGHEAGAPFGHEAGAAPGHEAPSGAPAPSAAGAVPHQGYAPQTASAVASMAGMGGAVCLATPVRGGVPLQAPTALPAAFLVADLALLALVGRLAGGSGPGLRAPPGGGRRLLLQVCVART